MKSRAPTTMANGLEDATGAPEYSRANADRLRRGHHVSAAEFSRCAKAGEQRLSAVGVVRKHVRRRTRKPSTSRLRCRRRQITVSTKPKRARGIAIVARAFETG